eukprot:UN10316
MSSFYPSENIKSFIFPTNEISDFIYKNFWAGLSFYIDFRQND